MLGSILAWLIETILGVTWHRFFPPKTAESEERQEAADMSKPASSWKNTVNKL